MRSIAAIEVAQEWFKNNLDAVLVCERSDRGPTWPGHPEKPDVVWRNKKKLPKKLRVDLGAPCRGVGE